MASSGSHHIEGDGRKPKIGSNGGDGRTPSGLSMDRASEKKHCLPGTGQRQAREREDALETQYTSKKARIASGCRDYCRRSGYCSRCVKRPTRPAVRANAVTGNCYQAPKSAPSKEAAGSPTFVLTSPSQTSSSDESCSFIAESRSTKPLPSRNSLMSYNSESVDIDGSVHDLQAAYTTWMQLISLIPEETAPTSCLPPAELFIRATDQGILPETRLALRQEYTLCATELSKGKGHTKCSDFLALLRSVGTTFTATVERSNIMPMPFQTLCPNTPSLAPAAVPSPFGPFGVPHFAPIQHESQQYPCTPCPWRSRLPSIAPVTSQSQMLIAAPFVGWPVHYTPYSWAPPPQTMGQDYQYFKYTLDPYVLPWPHGQPPMSSNLLAASHATAGIMTTPLYI
mmetsp:Transcript_18488/g.55763  ORF Transcript_18488/g.55763 Transcript_18488/m.55763 type:complete len:398 (-) Transcript_18488:395-1588(-)